MSTCDCSMKDQNGGTCDDSCKEESMTVETSSSPVSFAPISVASKVAGTVEVVSFEDHA